ncbi:calcium proton exchanger [Mycena amicta]|nr:calcium proton exchanger [Mycena amicta]
MPPEDSSVASHQPLVTNGIPMTQINTTSIRARRASTPTNEARPAFTLFRARSLFIPERRIAPAPTLLRSLRTLLVGTYLNVLLVFIPIVFAVRFTQGYAEKKVFAFAFLALLSTAKIFGIAMEDFTLRVSARIGIFIRVLAGNALELISGIIAITQCQLEVLQASLIGSILINLLLVLGVAHTSGGWKFREIAFDSTDARTAGHMLLLGTVAALLPTIFAVSFGGSTTVGVEKAKMSIVKISRAVSVALIFCYLAFVFFQLFTHSDRPDEESRKSTRYLPRKAKNAQRTKTPTSPAATDAEIEREREEEEEEEIVSMSLPMGLMVAVVSCGLMAVLSEYLVSALSNLTEPTPLSKEWVGLILIPLAGTFARHDLLESAKYSVKDHMSNSLALSTGSSVNLALFIQPLLILLAWPLGKNLSLLYDPFETLTLFLCVLTINFLLLHGKGNWLSGVIMIVLYCLIAITFWFYTGTHAFSNLILAC